MSELKTKIQKEAQEALKSGDEAKRLVLNMLLTAVTNKEIEKRTKLSKGGETDLEAKSKLSDEEFLSVISTEAKKRKEAIDAYDKAGRADLADKERIELKVLENYLPKQISEEEIRNEVKSIISQTGATGAGDIGKVMSALMPKVKGKADGSLVNKIVREELK